MSLFAEMNRRNVFRVGVAYLAAGWLLLEVLSVVLEVYGAPEWVLQVLIAALVLGFPIALLFSWAFEITPEGLKKTHEVDQSESITHSTGKRLDQITIGIVVVAIGVLLVDRMGLIPSVGEPERTAVASEQSPEASESADAAAPDAPAFPPNSIAVLPFVNMSSDEEQEYFSDGLSEELLNLLAKIPELRVAARTSSFSFRGQTLEIPEIAERLKVAHVLEGSVRKAGDQVRITAQLIQAADGYHLWSETYDRTLDDIFAIQDEIAAHVVDELKVTLLGEAPSVEATDPQAYALSLQARHLSDQYTEASLGEAEALYEQALAIVPNYASGWAGLASVYTSQTNIGIRPYESGYALARETAEKALALDPDHADSHGRLGLIATSNLDFSAAAEHLKRALDLAPGNADLIGNAASLFQTLGRFDAAIELNRRRVTLDPVSSSGYSNLGNGYRAVGRYPEAIEAYRTAIILSPDSFSTRYLLCEVLMLNGESEAALEALEAEPFEVVRLIGLAEVYHALGRPVDSDAALAELIDQYEQAAPFNIAYVLAYRGEVDRAFEWLDKAVEYGDSGLSEILMTPQFLTLYDDPRWLPFLERIGLAPAQLDAIEFEVDLPD